MSIVYSNGALIRALRDVLIACDAAETVVAQEGGGTETLFEDLETVRETIRPHIAQLVAMDVCSHLHRQTRQGGAA